MVTDDDTLAAVEGVKERLRRWAGWAHRERHASGGWPSVSLSGRIAEFGPTGAAIRAARVSYEESVPTEIRDVELAVSELEPVLREAILVRFNLLRDEHGVPLRFDHWRDRLRACGCSVRIYHDRLELAYMDLARMLGRL